MNITCSLSDSQIEKLYAHIYATIRKASLSKKTSLFDKLKKVLNSINEAEASNNLDALGELKTQLEQLREEEKLLALGNTSLSPLVFDPKVYMQEVFNKISKAKDVDTAAKFLQQVPMLMANILTNPKFRGHGVDVNKVIDLDNKFNTSDSGILNVLKEFNPKVDPETLKSVVEGKKKDALNPTLEIYNGGIDVEESPRLKPYSVFTATYQEYWRINPNAKDLFANETVAQEQKRLYTVISKITEQFTGDESSLTGLFYDGQELALKVVKATDIDKSQRDKYFKDLITRQEVLAAKGLGKPGITQANQILVIVLSDSKGNELFFDENGNITDKENGKIVYQMMRDVRYADGKYTVPNIYGETSQILSPAVIAKNQGITVEEAEKTQQEEFKQLFDFKKDVLKNGSQTISLTGISAGVSENLDTKATTTMEIKKLPFSKDIYNTLAVVGEDTSTSDAGYTTIMIKGSEFIVDRPKITDELTNKIVAVLLNRDITNEEKSEYVNQFLNNNVTDKVKRHNIIFIHDTNHLTFTYKTATTQETKLGLKGVEETINLTNLDIYSDAELAEYAKTIKDVLYKKAYSAPVANAPIDIAPTRIVIAKKNVDSTQYRDYDLATNTFFEGTKSYIDFIISLDPAVWINPKTDPGFFNSYMSFRLPDAFTKTLDTAKKEIAQKKELNFLEKKDIVVQKLKEGGTIKGTISKVTTPGSKSRYTFTSSNGSTLSFYNPLNNITEEDYSKEAVLILEEDFIDKNGKVYPDPVGVYIGDNRVGSVQVTSYTKADRESLEKTNTPEAITVEEIEKLTPTDVPTPDEPTREDLRKGLTLDRKNYLDNNVTKEQLDIADAWVKESPLFSDKNGPSVQHVANIVNSNAYAQFIVAGKNLSDVKVLVNAATGGNMADVYHEAWHTFSQLYLTEKQKKKLYNNVRNSKPEYKNLSFFELEEIIAEEFRNYALTGASDKKMPVKDSIFKSILNFIKKLLGITNVDGKDVLFQKLYFAGKNPRLLNNYTPLIDNVMFDILNRGAEQINNKKEDALNNQDSLTFSLSIDSILSDIIDEEVKHNNVRRAAAVPAQLESKAGVIQLLLNPQNKEIAYGMVKVELQEKLKYWKKELGSITVNPFNELTTVKDLDTNAIAIIKDAKGNSKYVFLNSQVDNFENLNLSIKSDNRAKGQSYSGVDIIADYYEHKTLLNEEGLPLEVLVVNKYSDAKLQYDNYIDAGEPQELVLKEQPEVKELTQEQENILNKVRILQIGLNNWGNTKEGMVKYHIENSDYDIVRQQYIEIEDDTDVNTSSKVDGKIKPETISLEAGASKETIYILKSLFKLDKKGNHVKDELGFKQRVDFRRTWYDVVNIIGGVKDPQEQYDLLRTNMNIFPEFKQLVNSKLPNPKFAGVNPYENRINTAFFRDLGRKTKFDYVQNTIQEDGNIQVTVAEVTKSVIIRRYSDLFKTDLGNPYVNRTTENVASLDLDKLLSEFKLSGKDVLDDKRSLEFARAIGLYIDDIDIINDKLTETSSAVTYYGLGYIYKMIKKIADKEKQTNNSEKINKFIKAFKEGPIETLVKDIEKDLIENIGISSQSAQIKRIIQLQLDYGTDSTSLSTVNAKGDTVNPFINDHSMSMMTYGLNKAGKLSDLWNRSDIQYMSYLNPEINTFTNRSRIIRNLFDFNTSDLDRRESRELDIFISSGTQPMNEEGTNTTDADIYSKNLQEVNGLLKGGVIEFMRHGSKSQSFGAKITGNIIDGLGGDKKDPKLWIDINKFITSGDAENYAFKVHMLEYIAGEVDRINKFNSNINKFKNYKGYNRVIGQNADGTDIYAGSIFNAFDNVLTKDTKEAILKTVKAGQDLVNVLSPANTKNNPELSKLRSDIFNDVTAYFNEQSAINYKFLQEQKYVSPDLINKLTGLKLTQTEAEKVLIKAYTYNAWIHTYETATLFYGDTLQYDDIHKRNTGGSSVGEGYRTDKAMKDFHKNYLMPSSYAASIDKKNQDENINEPLSNIFAYDGKFNTAVIQDVKRDSIYLKYMIPALKKEAANKFKNATKKQVLRKIPNTELNKLIKIHGKNYTLSQLRNAMIDYTVEVESSPYKGMEESDGQGYITFDAYRLLKFAEGNWSDSQEALFKKIVAGTKIEEGDIIEMFPIYKVQNFGHLANTELPVNAMHKFSLMPLIPGVAIGGSNFDDLHRQMMKKNIQYVVYGSGSKVGSLLAADGKHDQIYEEGTDNTVIKKDITFTPNTIYLEYLKNVTAMSTVFKGKTIYSSQARGITIDGLHNQGEIINPDNAPAYNGYLKGVSNMRGILEIELLNEIGYQRIKNADGTFSYKGDLRKFMSVVQRELSRKDVPKHLIKFIGVTPDNTLKFDLSFHPNADTIESLIVAMIEKRLVKQKVKGEGLIQVTSATTNGIWDKEIRARGGSVEEIEKFRGTNNLPFYYPGEDGNTVAMKVAIALQGDYANLLNKKYKGEVIGDIDTLNIAIKDEEWLNTGDNRNSVTMTGVRIPVDALSSEEFVEVYHFLSPTAGPIIILPTEIVAKSGGDFDGDKLTTSLPNLNKDGAFVTTTKTNEEVENEVSSLLSQGLNKEAKALIKQQKKALENDLIIAAKKILELPDNYNHLIRPNSVYILKKLASDLESNVIDYDMTKNMHGEAPRMNKGKKIASPTRIFESQHNLFKHEVNLISKTSLGPAAIENKLHAIDNSIGFKMPTSYRVSTKFGAEETDKDPEYKVRMFLPHNVLIENDEEHISLSNVYSSDGMSNISQLNSQLLNGFLDMEKDAWAAYIQGNAELTPIMTHLFEAGIPEDYAIAFISQPLIREYAKQQRMIGSSYAKYTGYAVEEAYLKKYQAALNVIDMVTPKLIDNALSTAPEKIKVFYIDYQESENGNIVNSDFSKKELQEAIENGDIEYKDIQKIIPANIPFDHREFDLYVQAGNPYLDVYNKPNITNKAYYNTVTEAVEKEGVLDEEGNFDYNEMRQLIKNPNDPKLVDLSIATFLHFIELEKQVKGTQALKRAANMDTKTSKTTNEISKINNKRESMKGMSKVDTDTLNKMFNTSILASFADNQIIIDLINPLFPVRNNQAASNYINKVLTKKKDDIAKKYGSDRNSEVKFITNFKNAVSNFIYHNYVADIKKENGEEMSFEEMISTDPGSFTDNVFKILEKYPLLKNDYLILNQLTPIVTKENKNVKKQKSITLIDRRDVKGNLAEIYYQNLKELANPNVRKVKDDAENNYISYLFDTLSKISMYVNGQGYSTYGFNAALSFDEYMLTMQKATAEFVKNDMTEETFDFIFSKLVINNDTFKNYSVKEPIKVNTLGRFVKKNIFTVTPQEGVSDFKATVKASIATQFIGFGEDIVGRDGKRSTTQIYREQVGDLANTGVYSSADTIFVSIPGLRGDAAIAKREQDKTIKETIKAIEAGATILTDNKTYVESSKYNTGEQRLLKNLEAKGYLYSEVTVDRQLMGVWNKPTPSSTSVGKVIYNNNGLTIIENGLSEDFAKSIVPDLVKQIESQSYKQTKSASSYDFGTRWTRMSDNLSKDIKLSFVTGMQLSGYEITKEKLDRWVAGETGVKLGLPPYGYNTLDQYGKPLRIIPSSVIIAASNATGLDLSTYQASYNSVYDNNDQGNLIFHQDNTEQISDAPIVTLSLGLPMKFVAFELKNESDYSLNNQFIADPTIPTASTALKDKFINPNGKSFILSDRTVLVFDGKNRNVGHKIQFDPTLKGTMPDYLPEISVNKAFTGLNQEDRYVKTKDYRTVLTLRKIKDDGVAIRKFDKNTQELVYKNGVYSIINKPTQSSASVKEGVQELFNSNPELANAVYGVTGINQLNFLSKEDSNKIDKIFKKYPKLAVLFNGNKELYNSYLKSIFPEASEEFKGKLFFHGTKNPIKDGKFKILDRSLAKGLWFTKQLEYAKRIGDYKEEGDNPITYGVILNIQNPKHFYNSSGALLVQRPSDFEKQYDRNIDDAAIFHHPESSDGKFTNEGGYNQVVVFNENQVYIIGDENDIDKATQFLNSQITQTSNSVKEGVSELFESNPELASVGTPQQYSEWLNYLTTQGKLTGTQATEILYHGTYENFEEFDEEKKGANTGINTYQSEDGSEQFYSDSAHTIFFSDRKTNAISYTLLGREKYLLEISNALKDVRSAQKELAQDAVEVLKGVPYFNNLIDKAKKEGKTSKEIIELLGKEETKLSKKYKEGSSSLFTNELAGYENSLKELNKFLSNIDVFKKNANINFRNSTGNFSIFQKNGRIQFSRFDKGRNVITGERFYADKVDDDKIKGFIKDAIAEDISFYNQAKINMKAAGFEEKAIPVLLNLQNPSIHDYEQSSFPDAYKNTKTRTAAFAAKQVADAIKNGNDGVIYENIVDPLLSNSYGIFDTKQIYTLGSKQDIEGFKKFVTQPSTSVKSEINLGQYVKFNGETFIVTQLNTNGTVQIYNPTLEGVNAKKSVAQANLEILSSKAQIVNYQNTDYIVTPKNTIISLKSNKIMNWDENNGNREAILNLVSNEIVIETRTFGQPPLKLPVNPQERLINDEDVAAFKAYMDKSKGNLPKTFFTKNTKFAEFYNTATGKREGAPQETKWFLNKNNLYDLVDQLTSEVYIKNVDLLTGYKVYVEPTITPVDEKIRTNAINDLLEGVKNFQFAERLAVQGINYEDIIAKFENAITQEELEEEIAKLRIKLC